SGASVIGRLLFFATRGIFGVAVLALFFDLAFRFGNFLLALFAQSSFLGRLLFRGLGFLCLFDLHFLLGQIAVDAVARLKRNGALQQRNRLRVIALLRRLARLGDQGAVSTELLLFVCTSGVGVLGSRVFLGVTAG